MTFLQPFELLWEAITIPDEEKLQLESCIYDYNYGQFTTDDARVKLKLLYPSLIVLT